MYRERRYFAWTTPRLRRKIPCSASPDNLSRLNINASSTTVAFTLYRAISTRIERDIRDHLFALVPIKLTSSDQRTAIEETNVSYPDIPAKLRALMAEV